MTDTVSVDGGEGEQMKQLDPIHECELNEDNAPEPSDPRRLPVQRLARSDREDWVVWGVTIRAVSPDAQHCTCPASDDVCCEHKRLVARAIQERGDSQ